MPARSASATSERDARACAARSSAAAASTYLSIRATI
nr:MAG TPA_asm: hypothetical protein [Caudoviricetes sp.]